MILGNNVPDFVKTALKDNGVSTLAKYHKRKSVWHYLSRAFFISLFLYCKAQGLKLYDVETHGGSLRIYSTHIENTQINISKNVQDLLDFGMEIYTGFQEKTNKVFY